MALRLKGMSESPGAQDWYIGRIQMRVVVRKPGAG